MFVSVDYCISLNSLIHYVIIFINMQNFNNCTCIQIIIQLLYCTLLNTSSMLYNFCRKN